MALGAFLAGLLLSESSYRHELEADVEPFRGLLLALFFMSVGMSIDLAAVGASVLPVTLGVVGALIAKFIVVYAIVRALGSPQRDGLRVAALLAPASEFAFVLLPAAFGSGLIDATLTAQLTAVAALSMLVGMPLLALVDRVIDRLPRRSKAEDMEESFDGARGTALVVGFGRFGQIAAQLLLAEGVETILIDANAERIRGAARFGFKVYYGDGKRIDVLRAAGAAKARLIMLCLEDGEASLRVSRLIRHEFPMATLHVRAINREHALALMELGVDYQIRETFESALAFGRASLEALGVAPERAAEVEEDVRRRDIERLELQRWGKDPYAGTDLLGQPIIRPAPLIVPTRAAEALNPEAEAAVAESDGGR
jgi:CPA2 family monovalent cation:H+ antiporter-2/glutathione-regulated potassium-efflux system protein KefB